MDTSKFVKQTNYDSKITENKQEIPSLTSLAATAALNDFKNNISNISDLVKEKEIMVQK